jgi:hypothetical protein
MDILILLLASVGAAQIITRGKIFAGIREYLGYPFLKCSMCVGWWIGFLFYFLFHFVSRPLFWLPWGMFLLACASSALSYAAISLIDDFGLKIHHFYTDDSPRQD